MKHVPMQSSYSRFWMKSHCQFSCQLRHVQSKNKLSLLNNWTKYVLILIDQVRTHSWSYIFWLNEKAIILSFVLYVHVEYKVFQQTHAIWFCCFPPLSIWGQIIYLTLLNFNYKWILYPKVLPLHKMFSTLHMSSWDSGFVSGMVEGKINFLIHVFLFLWFFVYSSRMFSWGSSSSV
jgi:hypothetical protein